MKGFKKMAELNKKRDLNLEEYKKKVDQNIEEMRHQWGNDDSKR